MLVIFTLAKPLHRNYEGAGNRVVRENTLHWLHWCLDMKCRDLWRKASGFASQAKPTQSYSLPVLAQPLDSPSCPHGFGYELSQGLPRRAVGLRREGEWMRKKHKASRRLWCVRGGGPTSRWCFVHSDKRSVPPLSNWQRCHRKVRSQSRVCVCKSMSRNHLPIYTLHTQAHTKSHMHTLHLCMTVLCGFVLMHTEDIASWYIGSC